MTEVTLILLLLEKVLCFLYIDHLSDIDYLNIVIIRIMRDILAADIKVNRLFDHVSEFNIDLLDRILFHLNYLTFERSHLTKYFTHLLLGRVNLRYKLIIEILMSHDRCKPRFINFGIEPGLLLIKALASVCFP